MCPNSFVRKGRVFLEIVVIFFSLIFALPIYFLNILPLIEMYYLRCDWQTYYCVDIGHNRRNAFDLNIQNYSNLLSLISVEDQ